MIYYILKFELLFYDPTSVDICIDQSLALHMYKTPLAWDVDI